MSVQYIGRISLSTAGGVVSTAGVFSTLGDIMSTPGVFSTVGDTMSTAVGYDDECERIS